VTRRRAENANVPFQLRDLSWASRSVAYLMLAAAPYVFVAGVVLSPDEPFPTSAAVTVVCLVLALVGMVCWRAPGRMPRIFWLLVPFLSVVAITGLNVLTRDASTGAQIFFLWPVLYATNCLGRRAIVLTVVAIAAGEGLGVFTVLEWTAALSDWSSLVLAMALTAFIVSSLRIRNDRLLGALETQAFADSLTGLANRRLFDGELARAIAWAHRAGQPVALLTIDVDHFKEINDTWGHAVGDKALQLVATALCGVADGEGDVVARLGGDEFAVLLRADRMAARRAADEVRVATESIDGLPGGAPRISIGVALVPDHAGTAEELVGASDAALYEAKSGGRGRTAMAQPPAARHNVERLVTEQSAVRH
jgi:diguanylate cyclase (GGDEF)-like protein